MYNHVLSKTKELFNLIYPGITIEVIKVRILANTHKAKQAKFEMAILKKVTHDAVGKTSEAIDTEKSIPKATLGKTVSEIARNQSRQTIIKETQKMKKMMETKLKIMRDSKKALDTKIREHKKLTKGKSTTTTASHHNRSQNTRSNSNDSNDFND